MRKWLIIVFVLLLSITAYELSVSFALFESEKEFIVSSDIGKWEISVNDSLINETNTFSITSAKVDSDSNVREDYFAPGTSGYFDVVIDPNDTDVSIYYEIVCRTDYITNNQIVLNRIENVGKPNLINVANYTYAGVIPVSDIKDGITTTLRFYITWTNNDNNNDVDSLYGSNSANFEIPMTITFRQYTGEAIATASPTPVATPEVTPTDDANNG
jgi:hypothetical protein